jgi:hypothetical protein
MLDIVGNRDRSDRPEGSCSNAMLIHASAEAIDFPNNLPELVQTTSPTCLTQIAQLHEKIYQIGAPKSALHQANLRCGDYSL